MGQDSSPPFGLTRRRILGVLGTTGIVTMGAAKAQSQPVSYNRRRSVNTQADGVDLQVDWKEWYNGTVLKSQDTPTSRDEDSRPLIELAGVMPGDSGRVAIGLSVTTERGRPPPMEIAMRVREYPSSRAENGRTEPEVKAGDDSPDLGELQDHLDVLLWYDTGIRIDDTPIYGACDASFGVGDVELASGTLAEVAVTDESGTYRLLDATPGDGADQNPCLRPNEAMCLGFEWSIAPESSNVIQGDSVSFAIEFGARQCP